MSHGKLHGPAAQKYRKVSITSDTLGLITITQSFCRAHGHDQHIHTDHAMPSVAIARIYAMNVSLMRAKSWRRNLAFQNGSQVCHGICKGMGMGHGVGTGIETDRHRRKSLRSRDRQYVNKARRWRRDETISVSTNGRSRSVAFTRHFSAESDHTDGLHGSLTRHQI